MLVRAIQLEGDHELLSFVQGAFVRHGLTQRQCETEVLFQIIAGSDTTATAIRATMLYIITSPSVYQHLCEEIQLAIGENKISSPITSDEAKHLQYLQVGQSNA